MDLVHLSHLLLFFFIECKNIIDQKYAGDQQYKKREQSPLNKT
jgi:hypothetical protein